MKFGDIDKTDFLIPPFVLLYVYAIFANAFRWPNVTTHQFFHSEIVAWIGVALCARRTAALFVEPDVLRAQFPDWYRR